MKSRALLFAMVFAAAAPCSALGDDMGTSNFQSYSVPFNPRVPPVYPASTINDEFRAQSPVIESAGTHKFVSLEPKWSTFAPGVGNTLSAVIDPTREMLQISGVAPKQWAGVMQDLPIPTVVGDAGLVGYTLFTRMLPGFTLSGGDWGPAAWGILLGDTMRSDPEASQLWTVLTQMQLSSEGLVGSTITAELADYSAPVVSDGLSEILPFQFLSARVLSGQPSPGVFDTDIAFGVSIDGTFYQRIFAYEGLTVPIRQFALAQQTAVGDAGMGTFADFVRYIPIVPGDTAASVPFIGEILQLGSV